MKVRMYRNYDKFPYESDHHGNFNGRMIFTFFRSIGREFDCILVELTEGYKPLPLEKYEHYSGWQMELDQVVKKEEDGMYNTRGLTMRFFDKTYIGNPGDCVLNIAEKQYLILGVIDAEDTSPSSEHVFLAVQSFNPDDRETRLPAVGLPENTPAEIIDMIEKESARRDELISGHGEEDWG